MTSAWFLRTERLGFRTWTADDLPIALGLWGDPEVTRFIDARGRLSEGDVRQRLAREIETQSTHGLQYWPTFLLEGGEHVGCCGLRPYDPARRILEIGFHVRSAMWGRGYASEAARAVIDHAFGGLGAGALFAGHNPENADSRRLLLKLGFRYTHAELYPPTGLEHPSYLLGADDHAAARASR